MPEAEPRLSDDDANLIAKLVVKNLIDNFQRDLGKGLLVTLRNVAVAAALVAIVFLTIAANSDGAVGK